MDQVILGCHHTSWWIGGRNSILPFQFHSFWPPSAALPRRLSSNSELAVISHIWKRSALPLPVSLPSVEMAVHVHHTLRRSCSHFIVRNLDFGGGSFGRWLLHQHYVHARSCTNAFNIFIVFSIQFSVFFVIVGVQQWPL